MTQDDKEALGEFLRGAGFAAGVVGLLVIIALALGRWDNATAANTGRAEVVDKYRGCDIVRWSQSQLAEYKYFLYCEPK